MTEPNNKHYRYCFECDKWLTKEEINEIDLGEQPGGGSGLTHNCQYCRKDLGDQIQIFKCDKHSDIILKVWGVMDGENQEKIFYEKCPQEHNQEQQEPPSNFWNKLPLPAVIGGITVLAGGILVAAKVWLSKKAQPLKQKLETITDNIPKKEPEDENEHDGE